VTGLDVHVCRALDELLTADRARMRASQAHIDAYDGPARDAALDDYKLAEEHYARTYARTARLLIDLATR
jgi:hypothetical protein